MIDRTDLLGAIERERHKRLLVVQAPAGYGKTILLAQWRRIALQSGARVAWIGFERADRTEDRFLASIASSLINAGFDLPEEFSQPQQWPDADVMLNSLLAQGEAAARETWLIFEDWHLVQTDPITDLLGTLLRRMPDTWHVALSSRVRPRLNMVALRAQGQILELGKDDLRLSHEETRALLSSTELPMSSVVELTEVTEGWAIALRLAQLWLGENKEIASLKSSFINSIDGMADYLAAEVFSELSPDLQDFLLETSICARFNADLADAVRGRDDSAAYLDALKWLHGLATPLDEQRQWYRHHRIFAEFLESEQRRLSPERLKRLHACAADWFGQQGLLFEAVDHSRLSGDEEKTISLIESAGCVDICIRSGAPAARSLLDSLPSEVVRKRPRLRAASAAVNLKLGSAAAADRALDELRDSLNAGCMDAALERDLLIVENLHLCFIDKVPTLEDLSSYRKRLDGLSGSDWWLNGLMYNVQGRIEMLSGRLNEAVQSLERAYHIFDEGNMAQGQFFMSLNLALCYLFLGRLGEAEASLKRARQFLEHKLDGAQVYAAIAHAVDALLLYERNELPAAAYAAQLGLAGLEQAEGSFELYLIATRIVATVASSTSGLEAAVRVVERGRQLARYHGLGRMDGLLDCLSVSLLIDAGQWDDAAGLARTSPSMCSISTETGWLEQDSAAPVLCLLEISNGKFDAAADLATLMAERSKACGRRPAEIRAHLLTAVISSAAGEAGNVRLALRRALDLAAPEAIMQPFFEHKDQLLPLLRDFQRLEQDALSAQQANFLSGLILRMIATGKAKGGSERLTAREHEILAHLTQGGSNKVIARSLGLTENAVKFHLKNVFRKLGVENRAVAAAVAERMELSHL